MVGAARAVAARLGVAPKANRDDTEAIRQAYLLLFGRAATDREIALGMAYLGHEPRHDDPHAKDPTDLSRWERYAQALLAANEFFFVD